MHQNSENTQTPNSSQKPQIRDFKIILLGGPAVGKTSIALRLTQDLFDETKGYQSTLGAAYRFKILQLENCIVKLNIWDTSGQEIFKSLVPLYYRNSDAAVVVYNIVDKETWEQAKFWVEELIKHVGTDLIITIAGNKMDLVESMGRGVDLDMVQRYCRQKSFMYIETSAKTGLNVNKLFETIALRLVEKSPRKVVVEKEKENVEIYKSEVKKKKCC